MPSVSRCVLISGAMLVAGIVGSLMVYAYGSREPEIDPGDEALVALGNSVYDVYCVDCHGAELQGAPNWGEPLPDGGLLPPPHDMSGHTWHHADAQLLAIVKQGGQSEAPADLSSNMPAFETILNDQQIAAVIAYIQSSWPAEVFGDRRRNLNPGD